MSRQLHTGIPRRWHSNKKWKNDNTIIIKIPRDGLNIEMKTLQLAVQKLIRWYSNTKELEEKKRNIVDHQLVQEFYFSKLV